MVLANQKMAAFRRGLVIDVIHYYGKRLKTLTVHYACQLLWALGCGDDAFCWYDYHWTANKLLTNDPAKNQIAGWRAKDVSTISFIGGPPNRHSIYHGSLRTLVLDRIAVIALLEGTGGLDGII